MNHPHQIFQGFSSSDYYTPSRLRATFLHIFSRDLSKQEKFIDEFLVKTKFSKRYRLLLNQPGADEPAAMVPAEQDGIYLPGGKKV